MFNLLVPTALENIQKADDIGVDIGARILQRIADAGLSCEIDHPLRLEISERLFHCRAIFQRALDELKSLTRGKPIEPCLL